jgi:hypothetical protein
MLEQVADLAVQSDVPVFYLNRVAKLDIITRLV